MQKSLNIYVCEYLFCHSFIQFQITVEKTHT